MRIRSVYPALWTSLPVASLSIPARLMWVGLWNYADDEGRGKDDARLVKAALWALDDDVSLDEVEGYMTEIAAAGLIHRYEVGGRRFFDIHSWREFQHPQRSTPSGAPSCTAPGALHEFSASPHTRSVGEGNRNSSRRGDGDPLTKYLGRLHDADPVFADVDREWLLEMATAKGFTEADVIEQLYEVCDWWTNRATASQRAKKNGRRFLQTWFRRARQWASEHQSQEPTATDPVARRRAELATALLERLADLGKKRAQDATRQTLERFPDGDLDFLERIARRDYGGKA